MLALTTSLPGLDTAGTRQLVKRLERLTAEGVG